MTQNYALDTTKRITSRTSQLTNITAYADGDKNAINITLDQTRKKGLNITLGLHASNTLLRFKTGKVKNLKANPVTSKVYKDWYNKAGQKHIHIYKKFVHILKKKG